MTRRRTTPACTPAGRVAALQAVQYPPGYFTELVRLHNWPPHWVPQPPEPPRDTWAAKKGFAAAKRAAAAGTSWAQSRRGD